MWQNADPWQPSLTAQRTLATAQHRQGLPLLRVYRVDRPDLGDGGDAPEHGSDRQLVDDVRSDVSASEKTLRFVADDNKLVVADTKADTEVAVADHGLQSEVAEGERIHQSEAHPVYMYDAVTGCCVQSNCVAVTVDHYQDLEARARPSWWTHPGGASSSVLNAHATLLNNVNRQVAALEEALTHQADCERYESASEAEAASLKLPAVGGSWDGSCSTLVAFGISAGIGASSSACSASCARSTVPGASPVRSASSDHLAVPSDSVNTTSSVLAGSSCSTSATSTSYSGGSRK